MALPWRMLCDACTLVWIRSPMHEVVMWYKEVKWTTFILRKGRITSEVRIILPWLFALWHNSICVLLFKSEVTRNNYTNQQPAFRSMILKSKIIIQNAGGFLRHQLLHIQQLPSLKHPCTLILANNLISTKINVHCKNTNHFKRECERNEHPWDYKYHWIVLSQVIVFYIIGLHWFSGRGCFANYSQVTGCGSYTSHMISLYV